MDYEWHLKMADAQIEASMRAARAATARRERAMQAHPIGSTFSMLGSEFVVVEYGDVGKNYRFLVTVTYKNVAGEVRKTTWESGQFPICEWTREAA